MTTSRRPSSAASAVRWRKEYPAAVLDNQVWLLESLIQGTEYAVDVYFNSHGEAVICNILQHDFASSEDVSDRLYYTSADIIRRMAGPLEAWFDQLNERLGLRDYPVHVELRRDADGHMVPIEFNPLRFAGLGGTDVAFYGVGLRTYEAFLEDTPVDLAALYAAHPGKVYSMSLLNPAPEADLARPFDGAALCERFSHVLAYHGFDPVTVGFYGFLFLETDAEGTGADERDWLLRSDLMEFVGGAL